MLKCTGCVIDLSTALRYQNHSHNHCSNTRREVTNVPIFSYTVNAWRHAGVREAMVRSERFRPDIGIAET